MVAARGTMVREVNLTVARNLSPIFDEAVRKERPVMIARGRRERGLLLAREAMLRVLMPYQFDFYRHLPDLACLEPYVLRLSLTQDDAELAGMLFGIASAGPELQSTLAAAGYVGIRKFLMVLGTPQTPPGRAAALPGPSRSR
ncbi:MAG: hypothetical protein HYY04_06480 [Chloroflexi bacterium]|nr:hypothetical protein [Chloroflexota bacterium]